MYIFCMYAYLFVCDFYFYIKNRDCQVFEFMERFFIFCAFFAAQKVRVAAMQCHATRLMHVYCTSIKGYVITMHVLFQYLQNRISHSRLLIRLVSHNYSSLYFKLVRLTGRPSFCVWFDSTRIPKRSARTHVINNATMIPDVWIIDELRWMERITADHGSNTVFW